MSPKTIILHVELYREFDEDGNPAYTMQKSTPFGVLRATYAVTKGRWDSDGPLVLDGEACRELGRKLQEEEAKLQIELFANGSFGADEAA